MLAWLAERIAEPRFRLAALAWLGLAFGRGKLAVDAPLVRVVPGESDHPASRRAEPARLWPPLAAWTAWLRVGFGSGEPGRRRGLRSRSTSCSTSAGRRGSCSSSPLRVCNHDRGRVADAARARPGLGPGATSRSQASGVSVAMTSTSRDSASPDWTWAGASGRARTALRRDQRWPRQRALGGRLAVAAATALVAALLYERELDGRSPGVAASAGVRGDSPSAPGSGVCGTRSSAVAARARRRRALRGSAPPSSARRREARARCSGRSRSRLAVAAAGRACSKGSVARGRALGWSRGAPRRCSPGSRSGSTSAALAASASRSAATLARGHGRGISSTPSATPARACPSVPRASAPATVLRAAAQWQRAAVIWTAAVVAGCSPPRSRSCELAESLGGARWTRTFQRGHTAVSAVWGLVGLALLYAGLVARHGRFLLAGFGLFGLSAGEALRLRPGVPELGRAGAPVPRGRCVLIAWAASSTSDSPRDAAGPRGGARDSTRRLDGMFEEGLAELHTHLGGSVARDIMWSLAHEQGIALPTRDFWEFDRMVAVPPRAACPISIRSTASTTYRADPELTARRRAQRARRDRRRVPLTADHDARAALQPDERNRGGERDLDHIILAAIRGLDRASLEYPQVRAGLILMMDRTFTAEQNMVVVEKAIRYTSRGVVGVDIAGRDPRRALRLDADPRARRAREETRVSASRFTSARKAVSTASTRSPR